MNRRFEKPPIAGQRYRPRPGAYAVLMRGGQVLLTHQSTPLPEYQLPGGGVESGEQMIAALHREILEETGWKVGRLRKLGMFRRFTYMPEYDLWAEKLCHIYFGRPSLQVDAPSEYGHSAVWMAPEPALENVGNDGDRWFLSKAINSVER
ncbi:NUDIX hydrolase [Nereida sp. MMG025]|uniref:NUDIX hydrolase n=1 Tax=Nereida sp. MMG025 TaxID=2909981 RepID=UPI001F2A4F7A|nr:NUDIX hydrolase [Nereida sp. MMG025]MCF6444603.1 NUDIX hydrolase [Nereida sp. MMG025]